MKKLFILTFAVAASAVLLSSCKKDYTCSCTVLGVTTNTVLENVKKADAETACNNANSAAQIVDGSCKLD